MDFRRAAHMGIDAIRVPARCLDVELSEPLRDIVESGYQFAHVLVRLHGEPVGAIPLRLTAGRCPATLVADTIVERLSADLVRVAVRQAIERPLEALPLDLDQLTRPRPADDTRLPGVTVAVCTRGRCNSLAACLDAICELDHPDIEVIVVDNSPDRDGAERIVSAREGVRYLHEPGSGLDRARNRAIVAATREIVAFTDDDALVDSGWARAIARRFAASPEVAAVTGLVLPLELETEAQLAFERYLGFGRGFRRRWIEALDADAGSIALRHGNTGRLGTGANMAFRRSTIATIGGFDPALDLGTVTNGGGDLDMFFRIIKAGGVVVYEPTALVRHRHRREWHELERQLGDWGTAMRSYVERNRLNHPEERLPFAVLVSWLLASWHLRRLAWSVVDPHLSPGLVLREVRGLLRGRSRYADAQQVADEVARRFGASVPQPRVAMRVVRTAARGSREVGEHVIDLAEPITPFTPGGAGTLRLRITHEGRAVATAKCAQSGHTVSPSRLRDIVARAAGPAVVASPNRVRHSGSGREIASRLLAALQAGAGASRPRAGRTRGERRPRAASRS